ncbi:4615_t:CDS:2 [Funneliformis geosporum]|uniref:4615_t:CDS:1 n=1 Tax=Funneliformis geosporum TaxID=1117311 RepID=A0A9W4SR75_9GLOM|nr:4615_t:CDS:2 [Funneliformis geosporum]
MKLNLKLAVFVEDDDERVQHARCAAKSYEKEQENTCKTVIITGLETLLVRELVVRLNKYISTNKLQEGISRDE